jgi:hypothetical protein
VTKQEKNDNLTDEELEKKLDIIWKNWESRRECEKKHLPNFIKNEKKSL